MVQYFLLIDKWGKSFSNTAAYDRPSAFAVIELQNGGRKSSLFATQSQGHFTNAFPNSLSSQAESNSWSFMPTPRQPSNMISINFLYEI